MQSNSPYVSFNQARRDDSLRSLNPDCGVITVHIYVINYLIRSHRAIELQVRQHGQARVDLNVKTLDVCLSGDLGEQGGSRPRQTFASQPRPWARLSTLAARLLLGGTMVSIKPFTGWSSHGDRPLGRSKCVKD